MALGHHYGRRLIHYASARPGAASLSALLDGYIQPIDERGLAGPGDEGAGSRVTPGPGVPFDHGPARSRSLWIPGRVRRIRPPPRPDKPYTPGWTCQDAQSPGSSSRCSLSSACGRKGLGWESWERGRGGVGGKGQQEYYPSCGYFEGGPKLLKVTFIRLRWVPPCWFLVWPLGLRLDYMSEFWHLVNSMNEKFSRFKINESSTLIFIKMSLSYLWLPPNLWPNTTSFRLFWFATLGPSYDVYNYVRTSLGPFAIEGNDHPV